MLFVFYLFICCSIGILFEAEEGKNNGENMQRSAASNERTVHLDEGEYIEWGLEFDSDLNTISIDNIAMTHTNDGASDTLSMYLDEEFIGNFFTDSRTNYGHDWNVPVERKLGGPFNLSGPFDSSCRSLKLVANHTDFYGVEIDKIEVGLSTPSAFTSLCISADNA
eukprot:547218_1